jgi:hypothetical protein
MKKILVWDMPARLFHLAFAASLTASLAIGFLVNDEQPLFQLLLAAGVVAWCITGFQMLFRRKSVASPVATAPL